MANLSIKQFLNTLVKIVFSSPTSIIYIIVGVIFLISMITNIRKKKTIGKTLYLIGWMFIVVFLVTRYNSYLSTLLDNLINTVFTQIFFPNLATYVIIIILSNIIYIKSILNKKQKTYEKIINTIFFAIIMFNVSYTLDEIINEKLNIYDLNIYSNQKILVLVETTTVIFTLWQIFLLSKKIIKKLISISNQNIDNSKEKITNNDIDKNVTDNQQVVKQEVSINQNTVNQMAITSNAPKSNNLIQQNNVINNENSAINPQTPKIDTIPQINQTESKIKYVDIETKAENRVVQAPTPTQTQANPVQTPNNNTSKTTPNLDIFNQVPISKENK